MDINRFTEKAQEALSAAQQQATRRSHQQVDVEHLLMALLEQEQGLATPILQMGLDVEVPPKVEITGAPPPSEQNQLVITVKHDGIYLNATKMATPQELANAIGAQMRGRAVADKVVFINSEDQIPFDQAVNAMDAAHQGGAVKIGFLTDAPK